MVDILVDSEGKALTTGGKAIKATGGAAPIISSLNVTPTTSAQTITAPSGTDGYSPITVNAVTSSIDTNITAENIKDGVTILGVTGNYTGSGGDSTKYGVTIDSFLGNTTNGELQLPSVPSNLVFTNVTSLVEKALYYRFNNLTNIYSVSFPDLTRITTGDSMSHAFEYCSNLTSADLSNLTTISNFHSLQNCFAYCSSLTSVDLSSLVTINSLNGVLNGCFAYSPSLTSISFDSLTTVIGANSMQTCFMGCSGLTTVDFPQLSNLNGSYVLGGCFNRCISLSNVYFRSLTTTSFGSYTNQFNGMLSLTGTSTTHTLHFPSNLESTISKLAGYPTFGGDSTAVVLAFDLPATS